MLEIVVFWALENTQMLEFPGVRRQNCSAGLALWPVMHDRGGVSVLLLRVLAFIWKASCKGPSVASDTGR